MLGDALEAGRSRGAVEQRRAEEQDRRGEAAEQEVLHRAFGGARAVAAEGDEAVRAERERLERHEEREQIRGAAEHHRAEHREEQDEIELATLEAVLVEVAAGEQGRERAATADGHVDEEREPIEREVAAERQLLRRRVVPEREREARAHEQDEEGHQPEVRALFHERIDEHHDEAGAGHPDERGKGRERAEVVGDHRLPAFRQFIVLPPWEGCR